MDAILSVILFFVGLHLLWALIALIFFQKEIAAAQERDPAAKNRLEIALLYPGLHAIMAYRIAHSLWRLKIPFIPRAVSQLSRFLTGIEIHPGAQIGHNFFIDHGMGVVIGETTIIGDNVTLFQGVTLGGTGKEKGKRHPTLGNNIVVGAGAKVLGNITIGDNSYIGANAVIVKDVPHNATIVGVPGRITRQDGKKIDVMLDHAHIFDPVMQRIEELTKRIKELQNQKENKESS